MLSFTRIMSIGAVGTSVLFAAMTSRAPDAAAQPDTLESVPYALSPTSAYEVGCFGPCDCAVQATGLKGTFRLTLQNVDPLFRNYLVEDVDWVSDTPSGPVTIRGRGTYRIGGEVAVTHQLTLDLLVNGVEQHFDSGLVPGGSGFPAITIRAPSHDYACHDSLVDVRAKPASAGVIPEDAGHVVRAVPNPFRDGTQLEITIDTAGPIEVVVLDGQGRRVRSLRSGGWWAAGIHSLSWDGRLETGPPARQGLYFVRVRTRDHEWLRRVVKLD